MTKRKRPRFLPDHVTKFRDRHSKLRYRYRRAGYVGGYFHSEPGTEEFRMEYAAFEKGKLDTDRPITSQWAAGTVGDLVTRYISVPSRLGPSLSTQSKVRAIVTKFRDEHGKRFVMDFTFEHIDRLIEKKREKVKGDKRMEGGVEAARKLRKELVRLFDYAEKIGMREKGDNPAKQSQHIRVPAGERSKGYYSWTEADIAQYRAKHKIGTKARLALELLLWTGQRKGDGIYLGPDDIRDGRFELTQSKGGKELGLLVAPPLLAAIAAMPPLPAGAKAFLLTDKGTPYKVTSFGNRMRKWCDEAGLPKCTAHGLRKANARRLADLGMSNRTLKAVGGWTNDREVSIYTEAANQRGLADDALTILAKWESNLLGLTDEGNRTSA